VLALGEAGIETNTLLWKVGDGTTAWANLAYMGSGTDTFGNITVTGAITLPNTPSGAANTIQYGLGNLVSYLDGGWVIGEYNGTDYGTEGIRISPGIEGAAEVNIPSNGTANVNPLSVNNYAGNVVINTGNNHQWIFNGQGQTVFPVLSTQRGDNPSGTISGFTLNGGDGSQEFIITTPDAPANSNSSSQRLVINPGAGDGSGEGGDIYLWAGRGGNADGNGGDVKIRGGQGMGNGPGGYLRIEAGDTQGNGDPGYIQITGGEGGNTYGGYVNVTGGYGATVGGDVKIYGGYGQATGGNVNIWGGASGNGQINEGHVNIQTGGNTWTFDAVGNLTLPSNTSSINYANGQPYGGSSIPVEPTANGYFSTLPDFLQFVGGTLIRTGQTSEGVFFDSNAGDGDISYPVRTNFSIGGTTPVVVTVDVVVNDECSDFGLCVFEGTGIQPQWAWDPNSTRIAAQYNCTQPEIYTLDDSASSGYNIPAPGTYRVRFTYDPTNAPNIILETLDTSNVVLDTLTMGGTLNTSNDYYIGFSADQDNTSLRTYIQNLTIAVGGGSTYTDSLQLSGGGANTGNVTFSNQTVIGTGDQYGGGGLYLAPGTESVGNLQYLRVRGGDYPTHIHFDTGNNQYFDQYFGDDYKYVKLANTGNIVINSNDNVGNTAQWTFGTDGNITVPSNTWINTTVGSNANINFHPDGTGTVVIQGSSPILLNLKSDTANVLNRIEVDTFGSFNNLGGTFTGTFSRGNLTSPQAVQAGDRLASLRGKGYNGSFKAGPFGIVSIDAFDTWTPGNTPSQLSFWTTGYNSNTAVKNMTIDPLGNVSIYNGNIIVTGGGGYLQGNTESGNGGVYAGIPGFTELGSNVVAQFAGNANSYSQINFQNISDNVQASGDIIITANNGTDSTNFIDMGIAGNTWDGSQENSLGTAVAANDGYLYVNGGNLVVGTYLNSGPEINTWKFGTDGVLTTPGTSGNITGANVVSANTFAITGNTILSQVEGSNTVGFYNPSSNTEFLIEMGPSSTWGFNGNTGGTGFPTLSTQRGDNPSGTITGQTLLFGDSTQEAIIATPNGTIADNSSQRLVINPGEGYEGGEGGDIYLWAGRGGPASGSGGDIKIRGGQGGANTSGGNGGDGGYIRMEAGDAAATGGSAGYIEITGGVAGYVTPGIAGGYIRVTGGEGQNGDGGDANITGGQGGTGYNGGDVNITGGISSSGLANYGNVNISAGASTWTFDNTGLTTIPGGISAQTGNDLNIKVFNPTVSGGVTYTVQNRQVDIGNSRTTQFEVAPANIILTTDYSGAKYQWTLGNDGEFYLPTGGRIGATKGGTMLDGGNANSVSLTSFYGNGYYAGCFTANPDGNVYITTYTGNGVAGTWQFDNTGNLTANGNITANTFITPGTAGDITMTGGNITGANVVFANTVSATANITSGNVLTGGLISATANITSGNVLTAGIVSATGDITGASFNTTGAGGDIVMSNGDVTGARRVITTPTALANLTPVAGGRAFVNDGNLVAVGNFGSQIGASGSNVVPVWSDGSNWYIG
jgi:hypothetical protein